MSEQLLSEAVSTCACRHKDSRECYITRYPPPMDDLARAEYFDRLDADGEYCGCGCHDDYDFDLNNECHCGYGCPAGNGCRHD